MENIWAFLRSNYLSHWVLDTYEAILQACGDAWNALMNLPDTVRLIADTWARVRFRRTGMIHPLAQGRRERSIALMA